jgi:Putative phage abortive infection protein
VAASNDELNSDSNPAGSKWLSRLLQSTPWFVFFSAVFLMVTYYMAFNGLGWGLDPDRWGTFGDYIGGILNPLISTCTLLVAVAVWKLQNEEMRKTSQTLQSQLDQSRASRRDEMFSQMIAMYMQTLTQIQQPSFSGRYCVQKFAEDLLPTNNLSKNDQNDRLEHFWSYKAPFLSNYLRVVFNFLNNGELLFASERFRLIKLFRAQISEGECIVLAANLFSHEGKNMIPLVKKYGLLKHLPSNTWLRKRVEDEIGPECFGRTYVSTKK